MEGWIESKGAYLAYLAVKEEKRRRKKKEEGGIGGMDGSKEKRIRRRK